MIKQPNFLIGRGERLTHPVDVKQGFGPKAEVYTFAEAKSRLLPQIEQTSYDLDALPELACPEDLGVTRFVLNPSYIAKSFYPASLLRAAGLLAVGSRITSITPEKWSKRKKPSPTTTTEIFVAGQRRGFRHFIERIDELGDKSKPAEEFARIEQIGFFSSEDKFKDYATSDQVFFEVAVHLLPDEDSSVIQGAFEEFANSLGVKIYSDLSFIVKTLWFVPVEGDFCNVQSLCQFSFVRVVRPMPKLRGLRPFQRSSSVRVPCTLPNSQPLSSDIKVAILDGGLPAEHVLSPWLGVYGKLDPHARDDDDANEHGLGVTSAFMFGPIQPNGAAARPFSYVDHYRVLDRESENEDPFEMYRTLIFIEEILRSRRYEFVNLSLGPNLPVEDTDVHAWTALIDDLLDSGDTFMSVAAGNNGDNDYERRILVPSDSVNAMAVGSASHLGEEWGRASYSAVGPGRSPGVVKPDLLAFGGSAEQYFHVLAPGNAVALQPQLGTSFSAPFVLRNAVGVRAILGDELSALAIKALLIHSADRSKGYGQGDVGWGKMPEDVMEIITCSPGVARVVYKGVLKAGKYLRAPIPLPDYPLQGMVNLKATFCYTSSVDPQDSCSYTKAGLEVVFRPDHTRVEDGKALAKTKTFFQLGKYATEEERRSGIGKWETVMHDEKRMRGSGLKRPVFDIHYNARDAGGIAVGADEVNYALVVTVEASKHEDIFNDILRAHSSVLAPIQPTVSLPIRV